MTTPNPFKALITHCSILLLVSCSSQQLSEANKTEVAQTKIITEHMHKHLKKVPDWAVSPLNQMLKVYLHPGSEKATTFNRDKKSSFGG